MNIDIIDIPMHLWSVCEAKILFNPLNPEPRIYLF